MSFKNLLPLLLLLIGTLKGFTQNPIKAKPAYCNDVPSAYETGSGRKPKPLPVFNTKNNLEYRVQVAVLRDTDPRNYSFHNSLVARYQPCEQIWIVESKKTYKSRDEAEKAKAEFGRLGYTGCYITTIVTYE